MEQSKVSLQKEQEDAQRSGHGENSLHDQDVLEWDSKRISEFVANLGFEQHAEAFANSGLTGIIDSCNHAPFVLIEPNSKIAFSGDIGKDLSGLSASRLKELNIRKLGERKRIKAAFGELLQAREQLKAAE